MSKEIAEEYASSLSDLTVNSKPLINMLTILAEENIEHAGVIVETVEKHLEKVHPDIKLPILYLVDSIIKNVGGAYTSKFSEKIVNMFTRTFKQVDEKTRSQMFKLRETWHDVFPATKLYQLDVKVNLIDPAWPIQAQPQPSNIHVNPNYLKKPVATTSAVPVLTPEEEKMRAVLARKEQELLMLQRKKVEMELEQARRQCELAEKGVHMTAPLVPLSGYQVPMAMVNPHVSPALGALGTPLVSHAAVVGESGGGVPVKQRLGPPVAKATGRIAPVSAAMLVPRRDPRLARAPPATPAPPAIAPNVFDIKPLDKPKRKNFVTIDVRPEHVPPRKRPERRDPRLEKKKDVDERKRQDKEKRLAKKLEEEKQERNKKLQEKLKEEEKEEKMKLEIDANNFDIKSSPKNNVDDYINRLQLDHKKISKLPPIPKLSRNDDSSKNKDEAPSPVKKRKEAARVERKKKPRDGQNSESSPEKKAKAKEAKEARKKQKEQPMDVDKPDPEVVSFKELKNYHKERYRRNRDKSESPEKIPEATQDIPAPDKPTSNIPGVVESKDVDLRVLAPIEAKASPVAQKRPSTEGQESKTKKTKLDKFDILFGNEDVDLRQLPQVEEVKDTVPLASESPKADVDSRTINLEEDSETVDSPQASPKGKDWTEVKKTPDAKGLSKLDQVRAKLAEATKRKDLLGRPSLSKSPSLERERRRTISNADDTDLRTEGEDEVNKETISLILSQAKEHFKDGKMDKNQYNTLMFQVMQLNEKLKLKEAKQRESLEMSKRKLHKVNVSDDDIEQNRFGDIDERVTPAFMDTPPNSQDVKQGMQDFDMRVAPDVMEGPMPRGMRPPLPMPPMFPMGPAQGPYPPMWRPMRPRGEDFNGPRRPRGPMPPFFRNKFDKRIPRPQFEQRFGPPLIQPKVGMCQGPSPLTPYQRVESPPPLGAPGQLIPQTDFRVIEYIDQDPMKTIDIDGVPREIRFYGETAVIMLDWDDPREIKFLPGARRITFDNKDSVVLDFNDEYKKVEIDEQVFDIRFGAPTRELYINGKWYECFFGAPPVALLIEGKPRMIQLDGPPPQVDIGKVRRTDLIAGKINLIVDAQHMCPVFLDGKAQKFLINNQFFSIRFADSLRTVLINEVPFKVEFGGLPKPIFIGQTKHFIRFSVLPRGVKPGQIEIAGMEGSLATPAGAAGVKAGSVSEGGEGEVKDEVMETDQDEPSRPDKVLSPDGESNQGGLDMLASVMPSSMAPASSFSGYSMAEPLFSNPGAGIPGLEPEEKPSIPVLGNINVNDLFAKLIATGIVQVPKEDAKEVKEEVKVKAKEDKSVIHVVDLMKPETLRGKQPGLVSRLYGGMQCSGCGARFLPEHTVRYSQHLDWHFRQNRRERDSARRAHSRRWHYDLRDWLTYEELEDLDEREKSWFETGGSTETGVEPAAETPSVAAGAPADRHCALCGDAFDQFYNEDKDEWHLRNSVRHEDKNYHPLCFDDYKASLAKEEPEPEPKTEDTATEEAPPPTDKEEDAIEIKDADESSQMSDTDDVEVIEPVKEITEALEIDEGEEDDVIYKAEPVEQVTVEDADTDDETAAERADRDQRHQFDLVKVKVEPVDPDDEPVITAEEEAVRTVPDAPSASVQSSIDGNLQLEAAPPAPPAFPAGGIRINITKTIPTLVTTPALDTALEDISVEDEPPPPGEEPELEYTLKPHLEGKEFSRQPPVQRGAELSGLCSIM
ncbi:hypothetical protein JYU34_010576 [Plutella xylostella]|uniref:CID domain-containing protein n=1 Tax=Plutella xylostella TaxID=51655 RepID=A0ABQ7QIR5_PLUXY|nr:hypothetical protein JYU34_010576 [Plutella xylostella]